MNPATARDLDMLLQLVREAAEQLTPQDVQQLVGHPDVVRSALAVAARTLEVYRHDGPVETLGSEKPGARVTAAVAARRLAARAQVGQEDDMLGADAFAARVGVKTRQSVHDWLKKNRVIGWSGAKRRTVFPAAQLDERGQPPAGLDRILPLFSDHYTAWVWLTTPLPALDGATPLGVLHAGGLEKVIAAATGDAQGNFA